MPHFEGAGISNWFEFVAVCLAGALVTAGLSALARWAITAGLERRGQRLDRWRRVWFHPERELGRFLDSLLILAFLTTLAELYSWPRWAALALFIVWALHLPADFRTWLACRWRPHSTLHLHQRGFFLLDFAPLWLRATVGGLAAAVYLVVPPVRRSLGMVMEFFLTGLQRLF